MFPPREDKERVTRLGAGDTYDARVRPATKRSRSEHEDSCSEAPPLESPRTRGRGSNQRPDARWVVSAAAAAPTDGSWGAPAGFSSGGTNQHARPDIAALLATIQERELVLARERQLALQISLLRQPPVANLDLQTQLLLLSSRLQQPHSPPLGPYSLGALDMQGLSAQQRQSVALAFFDGLSHAEVAEQLRQPLGTVKSWVRRALMTLRGCLERAARGDAGTDGAVGA